MDKSEIIDKTREFVEQKFSGEGSGHDWWHMYRVWQMAKRIAASEPDADPFVVELGGLLHDIADWKFHDGDTEAGPKAAREWLESLHVDEAVITPIEDIIRNVSFKGAHVETHLKTIEGKIVYDADKLDAIGAIGVARAFAYGGASNRPMHIPGSKAKLHETFEEYRHSNSTAIDHFHEKLLLLKDMMFTDMGKQIAKARHEYMEGFLQEFNDEWEAAK